MEYSWERYLAAKKTVDDRALNRHVWDQLAGALAATARRPLEVLEIGAGIGTMIERMLERGLLEEACLLGLDAQAENIAAARTRLPAWAARHGWRTAVDAAGAIVLEAEARRAAVALETIDLFDFVARERGRRQWDLLVAHAVLDLLDAGAVLPDLMQLVRPGGLLYLTITFDGVTILQPEIDPAFDALVEALYHETMDLRLVGGRPSGDSRAGRHLFGQLRAAKAEILAAGGSDWVVVAGPDGYPADEAYFLHFIVETIRGALTGHEALNVDRFAAWIAARHAQVERGELIYIAHQIDILAGRPRAAPSIG